jgi:hypothetical protein
MSKNRPFGVVFVVQYSNGQKHHILVERDAVRDGDEVALNFAQQQQRQGIIPDGRIATVRRLRRPL